MSCGRRHEYHFRLILLNIMNLEPSSHLTLAMSSQPLFYGLKYRAVLVDMGENFYFICQLVWHRCRHGYSALREASYGRRRPHTRPCGHRRPCARRWEALWPRGALSESTKSLAQSASCKVVRGLAAMGCLIQGHRKPRSRGHLARGY